MAWRLTVSSLPSFRQRGAIGVLRPGSTSVQPTPEFLRFLDQAIFQANATAATASSATDSANVAPVSVAPSGQGDLAPVAIETTHNSLSPVSGGCEATQELSPV